MELRGRYLHVRIDVTRDEDGEFSATLDDDHIEFGHGMTPQEAIEHLMLLHDSDTWWPDSDED